MEIRHGTRTKQISLYPLVRLVVELECTPWLDEESGEIIQLGLTISQAMSFKENID